ncbi:hypothetical protein EMCRGX_G024061 [Ephydatia muelleri]
MFRGLRTNRQQSETSLSISPVVPVELNSLACGRLEGPNGRFIAQCTLVNLGDRSKPLGGQDELYGLVTTHHAVASLADLEALKLVLGTKERPLKYTLAPSKIVRESFVSCCGERGIWKANIHPNEPCPYKWNWTLVALKPAFVQELCAKQRLTFLTVSHPPPEAFKSRLCHVFARRPDGDIISQPADLKNPIVQPSGLNGLEDEVNLYTQSCPLRYTPSAFQPTEPGSAIVYCANSNAPETWRLLGIHSSCPREEQCEGRFCELVPCLSFFQQTLQYQCAQMFSLKKLSSCLEKQIVENEDALKKQKLMQVIQMLGFVLSSTADQAQLNLQPQARDCIGMRFLCNLFSCFEGLSPDLITEVLSEVPALVKDSFLKQAESICKQLFELLNDMIEGSTDDKLVEMTFELWLRMLHFNFCEKVNDSQGFAAVNSIRSWERMKTNAKIQQLFGDISFMHQQRIKRTSIRDLERQKMEFDREKAELENVVREKLRALVSDHQLEIAAGRKREEELSTQVQKLNGDKKELLEQNMALQEEMKTLKQELVMKERQEGNLESVIEESGEIEQCQVASMSRPSNMPLQEKTTHVETTSAPMTPAATPTSSQELQRLCDAYPARSHRPSICPGEGADFWSKDITKLLTEDLKLRDRIANYFTKVAGEADCASWENLIEYLHLKMNPDQLETSPSGDILLSILKVWSRKDMVTIRCFCNVCNELGITVVEKQLKMVEQNITASESSTSSLVNLVEGTEGNLCSPAYNV